MCKVVFFDMISNTQREDMEQELPYNEANCIMEVKDVEDIFHLYGLNIKPFHIDIYRTAMVHCSYCTRKNETYIDGNVNCPSNCIPLQETSNQLLEFLGDTVISTIVGKYLYDRYHTRENEGFLTKMRTKIVNGNSLAEFCNYTPIPKYMIISKQIEATSGRQNKKILEDTFEAFVGAMYSDFSTHCDNAMKLCETWLIGLMETNIDFSQLVLSNANYKDIFIKKCQHTFNFIPKFYEINNDANTQGRQYDVCIKDENMAVLSTGSGPTKRVAENNAAYNALEYMGLM